MGENKNMEKLAALQKEFFATGQTRELTFRKWIYETVGSRSLLQRQPDPC